ncbi:hypothetical protein ACO0K0_01515 [Undibacterium sp. SXout11W]|uniref:hypothetical protein n=1 Tax=Undibacterium sp. SXout11W TaxID=3413050 RepID=UPI003BF3589D
MSNLISGLSALIKSSIGSTLIGFVNIGVASIQRTVNAKLSEKYSVLDAGADNTGATATATKIQNAINSGFGEIEIPDGKYLIDTDLIVPDNVRIKFSENAIFLAGKDGLTFFRSNTHAYFSSIHSPRFDANGHANVTCADMISFRLHSGIYNPFMMGAKNGIVFRNGCFGTEINNPTSYAVKYPVIFISNNSGSVVRNPNFDNSPGVGGDGTGSGVTVQYGGGSNLGVQVLGGYIQGFVFGVDDGANGTLVEGTYFEQCSSVDITANTTARNCKYEDCEHWGTIGLAAYRFRNTDSMTIWNPTMGSGARTVLYDIDGTNTNCVEYRSGSNASLNMPTGDLTYVSKMAVQSVGTFVPTIVGSTTAGAAIYTVQTAKFTKTGSTVSMQISISWSGHTGTGAMLLNGLPAGLAPLSFAPMRRFSVSPGFAVTGISVNAAMIGAGTTIGIRQISNAGVESLVPIVAAGSIDVFGTFEI